MEIQVGFNQGTIPDGMQIETMGMSERSSRDVTTSRRRVLWFLAFGRPILDHDMNGIAALVGLACHMEGLMNVADKMRGKQEGYLLRLRIARQQLVGIIPNGSGDTLVVDTIAIPDKATVVVGIPHAVGRCWNTRWRQLLVLNVNVMQGGGVMIGFGIACQVGPIGDLGQGTAGCHTMGPNRGFGTPLNHVLDRRLRRRIQQGPGHIGNRFVSHLAPRFDYDWRRPEGHGAHPQRHEDPHSAWSRKVAMKLRGDCVGCVCVARISGMRFGMARNQMIGILDVCEE